MSFVIYWQELTRCHEKSACVQDCPGFTRNLPRPELATRIRDAQPKAVIWASCGIEPKGHWAAWGTFWDWANSMSKVFTLESPNPCEKCHHCSWETLLGLSLRSDLLSADVDRSFWDSWLQTTGNLADVVTYSVGRQMLEKPRLQDVCQCLETYILGGLLQ